MTTPYASLSDGNTYFSERLRSEPWDDASAEDRNKALKMATRAIDKLNFAGDKADATQERQFPRGDDTEIPQPIMDATCELALAFLDDVDPNLELERLSRKRQGIGDLSTERDTSYAQEHIVAGIPSIQAWTLLYPFLRDPKILDVDRS